MTKFYANAIRLACATFVGWDFTDKVEELFNLNELDFEERLDTLIALRGSVPVFVSAELERLIEDTQDDISYEDEDVKWFAYNRSELENDDRRHGIL